MLKRASFLICFQNKMFQKQHLCGLCEFFMKIRDYVISHTFLFSAISSKFESKLRNLFMSDLSDLTILDKIIIVV